jgi:hypothetical protein
MNYLRESQRRVKEIELSRWVNYFLQIPLETFVLKTTAKVDFFLN